MPNLQRYNLRGKADADVQRQIQNIVEVIEDMRLNPPQQKLSPAQVAAGSAFSAAQLRELTGRLGAFAQAPIGTTTTDPLLQGIPTGNGTVTSFSAGDLSPLFTTSEATVTTTPALSFTAINQNANIVYAGPSSGAASAPTFRALTLADLYTLGVSLLGPPVTLNLNTSSKQTLITVPTGKSALPLMVVGYAPSVDLSGGVTTFLTFGFNAGATDWSSTNNYSTTGLTTATLYQSQSQEVASGNGTAVIGTTTQIFGAKCDAAFGSAATLQVAVLGILF